MTSSGSAASSSDSNQVDQLISEIIDQVKNLPPKTLDSLKKVNKGYVYEAWVLCQIGASDDFVWEHPLSGPAFATGAGGRLVNRLRKSSYLKDRRHDLRWVQGVTARGVSGANHLLDIVLIPRRARDDLCAYDCIWVLECKNYGQSVGIDVARGALGLSIDLRNHVTLVTNAEFTKDASALLPLLRWPMHYPRWGFSLAERQVSGLGQQCPSSNEPSAPYRRHHLVEQLGFLYW